MIDKLKKSITIRYFPFNIFRCYGEYFLSILF